MQRVSGVLNEVTAPEPGAADRLRQLSEQREAAHRNVQSMLMGNAYEALLARYACSQPHCILEGITLHMQTYIYIYLYWQDADPVEHGQMIQ